MGSCKINTLLKSPLTITYSDLIKQTERRLTYMEGNYPALVQQGKKNEWAATHEIECQKVLLRMLKKHQKNPQLNLNDVFDKTK